MIGFGIDIYAVIGVLNSRVYKNSSSITNNGIKSSLKGKASLEREAWHRHVMGHLSDLAGTAFIQ